MGQLKGIARRGARRALMEEVESASVGIQSGIDGDYRGTMKGRQVTILASQDWQAACTEVGVDLPWTNRRANLLVDDVILPRSAGAHIRVGECVFEVTGETDPCERMDEQHGGLRLALVPSWRGGCTCDVVSGGDIQVGDSAEIISV